MSQHHNIKVKLSDQQLNILKSEIKTAKNVTLLYVSLLSNKIGTDETNFAHNLLLTERQVPRLLE